MTRILVTGATGFVGSHLIERLLQTDCQLFGLSRRGTWPADLCYLKGTVSLAAVDLTDPAAIREYLRANVPDQIYHLAGQANVPASQADPAAARLANVEATRNLYEAVLEVSPAAKILHVSTGMIYGVPAAGDLPITEQTPIQPKTAYAQTKAEADELARQLVRQRGARIVIARPFNQIGPRQQTTFAVANFARQVAALERQPPPRVLKVGNLSVERDFVDVRDVVVAYQRLMELGDPGEVFNIASGKTVLLRRLLDQLISQTGKPFEVTADPALLRSNDPPTIQVSIAAIHAKTGWSPFIPLEQTLRDTLDDWRRRTT